MKIKIKKLIGTSLVFALFASTSCSLEEVNPSGFTMETIAESSVSNYKTIINNCYYGWQQRMYGCMYWTYMAEAGTDMWTYQKNGNSYQQYFKYDLGLATSINTFKDQWLAFYDGIAYCNKSISLADKVKFTTVEAKNALVAEAYFLRAIYYLQLVEQFGGVTIITKPSDKIELHPLRATPLEVYEQVIIPDLEFAAQWLPVTNELSRPSRKSAIGYLASAYLQTVEYDDSKSYASKALSTAKLLIDDCENGGTTYGAFMYPTFKDVFDENNNFANKEALWAHRFIANSNPRNPEQLNENNQLFYCPITSFGAIIQNSFTWGGRTGGQFMPSHYLMKAFKQEDGTIDPRFRLSFQTMWKCNSASAYTWSATNILNYDKSTAVTTTTKINIGDTAVVMIHPSDPDYNSWLAKRRDSRYLVVDLNDIYANDTVRMKYWRNTDSRLVSNPFLPFYPSLSKHNSSHIIEVQVNKKYGNLNAVFMMRMSEVYLIAAEADLYANGGTNTLKYINKIRSRAGAKSLTATPSVQMILDERARELCGEGTRWNDLKRTKMLNKEYLMAKNPDVGQYFKNEKNTVRQIPLTFLQTLDESGTYYQNPNY